MAGQTTRGSTAWTVWQEEDQTLGLMTQVDASAARFRSVPRYVAHLAGERAVGGIPGIAAPPTALLVPFSAVADPTREGFLFQVLLPSFHSSEINPPAFREPTGPDLANQLGLHVVWLAYAE